MIKSNTIEFRINNPMCTFCKNSSMRFFQLWCSKKNECKNLDAKSCKYYEPTLEHIEKRSQ